MNTLKTLLSGLARTAAAKPALSPVAHSSQPASVFCSTTFTAPTAPRFKDHSMTRYFPSPLATQPDLKQSDVDRLCVIYADSAVQRAADNLHHKLNKLNEIALYRSLIAQAINLADKTGIAPIEALRRMEEEADEALEDARADHRAHDIVVKARNERLRPLILAVGEISIKASAERESITRRISALESNYSNTGVDAGRFHHLQAAGLTRDQMAALGQPDPEVSNSEVSMLRARLVMIESVLAQCRAFSEDPLRRSHHLEGLGVDDLIEARRAAEQASA